MKKRVLVVEDNIDNMDLIEVFLEDVYSLIFANDGKIGLEKTIEEKPDLVLLDISLPIMDGTEVIKKIREDETISNIPVIALTAHAMMGDRESFLKQGFTDYLSKPIEDEDILIDLIESHLNKAE
jgi:CheY-like chemotaxis protein